MGRVLVRATRRQILAAVTGILFMPAAAPGVLGAPPVEHAESLVRDLAEQVWALLQHTDPDDISRIDQLAGAIEARTDVDLLSRLVLGRYWRDLDDAQRAGYQQLFRAVVMRKLALRLNRYAAGTSGAVDEHFKILGAGPVGQGDVLVRSSVRPETGEPLAVDWRVRERDGGAVIIDLIVGGVSLVISQRSEFAAVIERSDVDGLLAELRARATGARPSS